MTTDTRAADTRAGTPAAATRGTGPRDADPEEWTGAAVLGVAPPSHPDPCLGGPPLASLDGRWWWDGARWVLRHHDARDGGATDA